jgi:hypothetical protein
MAFLAGFIGQIITFTTSEILSSRGEVQFCYPVTAINPIFDGRAQEPISPSPIVTIRSSKLNCLSAGYETPDSKL